MLKFAIILAAVAVCYGQVSEPVYYLYTGPVAFDLINPESSEMPDSFEDGGKTMILVHGYGGNRDALFNQQIKTNLFRNPGDFNVIVVDWGARAGFSNAEAARNVPSVADNLTKFIDWLIDVTAVTVDQLHLVGFGLGAHVVGIASRNLEDGIVGRITGLDPSGVRLSEPSLNTRDAIYVEVIHTDSSGLLANGDRAAIGHINFYANGGSNQPGCLTHSCSHNRAYELFAVSLDPLHATRLEGRGCNSRTQLNLNLCSGSRLHLGGHELTKLGYFEIYRVNTRRSAPFY